MAVPVSEAYSHVYGPNYAGNWGTPMVHPKAWHYVFCQECDEANEVIGGTDLRTLRVITHR